MGLPKRDSEFRHYGTTYLELKQVEMDRVLTTFLMRVNHRGQTSRLSRDRDLTADGFVREFTDDDVRDKFPGFAEAPEIAGRWIETHLLDIVNRGKPNQAVAGLRPLHGLTYKFRNSHHSRPYGADAQLYEMFRHARGQRGERALEMIKTFFFTGLDPTLGRPVAGAAVTAIDVETQAVLHLDSQVRQDAPQTVRGWYSAPPLCVGQADLLADDTMRLLALADLVPRTAMVEYLKILFAFHLALGQLRLMKLLPALVERGGADPACGLANCPADPANGGDPLKGCPYQVGLFIDAAGVPGSPAAQLSERNAEVWFNRIPGYVRAAYAVRKLDEFATDGLAARGLTTRPAGGHFTVEELLRFAGREFAAKREEFFGTRITLLLQDTPQDQQPEEVRPLLDGTIKLSNFEQYLEVLMAYRGEYHRGYIVDTLDSLLLKNRPGAVIAQPFRGKRRFIADSRLLEVLVQIALLEPASSGQRGFQTRPLRLDEFLDVLRTRYGLYIDRLPTADGFGSVGIAEQAALRANTEAFTTRMREIGFYSDLSDAYLTQVITPRFVIEPDGTARPGGTAT